MSVRSAEALRSGKTAKSAWQPQGLQTFANLFERSPAAAVVTSREWVVLCVAVVVGAVLRFWGMRSWGLENDEETMAMPVMHILEHGTPVMPSGMVYVRALGQLYLMAASVWMFGPTEWALRLPSAICGAVLVFVVFFMGRRFLSPSWNLAFTAAVALLAPLILDAHEARMYAFLLTSVTCFSILVFRWERTERLRDLIAAVAVMAVALQFHSLAVFTAFIVFMPGLLRGEPRRLLQGMAAFGVIAVLFLSIDTWVESFFPPRPQERRGVEVVAERHLYTDIALANGLLLVAGLMAAVALVHWLRKNIAAQTSGWIAAGLVLAGLCAQLLLLYHIAALLLVVGLVIAYRDGAARRCLGAVIALCVLLALAHIAMLLGAGVPANRKLLGAMLGVPSVWTYIRFSAYAPIAAVVVALALPLAVWRIMQRRTIADFWLYFALAVWLPLFLIGFFTWYPEQRYTEIALLPLLLCAFAVWPGATRTEAQSSQRERGRYEVAGAAAACVLLVNPLATAQVVNGGYDVHVDHKGAAQYVRGVRKSGDIVLAEDVLQQTYYLGKVDYWLIGPSVAGFFSRDFDGRTLDIYTHTPPLTTAMQLQQLIARADRGTIYIIGSGEQQIDGRGAARGRSLSQFFAQNELKTVYVGRDRLTRVWAIAPPQLVVSATASPLSGVGDKQEKPAGDESHAANLDPLAVAPD